MGRMKLGNEPVTLRLPPRILADIRKVAEQQHGRGLSSLVAEAWERSRDQIAGSFKHKAVRA